MNKEILKRIIVGVVFTVCLIAIILVVLPQGQQKIDSSFNQFNQMATAKEISKADVSINAGTGVVSVEWKKGAETQPTYHFEDNARLINSDLNKIANDNNINLNTKNTKDFPYELVLSILIFGGIIFFMFMMMNKGGGGGAAQFGKSKAKLFEQDTLNKVTFDDVAGIDEVKEELKEIIDFLKTPEKYTKLGALIPRGVMLAGAPGVGKTLIAKAVAGEAGVPFYSISGSEFVELYVGVGPSRVRDLFSKAKKTSPSIVFIDELDAIGRVRSAGATDGGEEKERTLIQLLVEMDGFEKDETVIVIGATNRADVLDPALLRPGRFDRRILVGNPDVRGREEILRVHSKNKPLGDDVDLKLIARRTVGFTGADLANVMNESALLSGRKGDNIISMKTVEQAVEREIAGPEKINKVITDKDKKLVAFHEAGHAVVANYLDSADQIHKISIVPRGMAGGYTLMLPDEDKNFITRNDMMESVSVLLGGRVSEKIVLGDISSGASNDLERASDILRSMITEYGMSEELGSLTYGKDSNDPFFGSSLGKSANYSDETAAKIDAVASKYMDECYQITEGIINKHRKALDRVAEVLIEKEVIDKDEFIEIIKEVEC